MSELAPDAAGRDVVFPWKVLTGALVLLASFAAAAGDFPAGSRLVVAAALASAAAVPFVVKVRRSEAAEVGSAAAVLAGMVAFLALPEAPVFSLGSVLIGLLLAIGARPVVERVIVVSALAIELVKVPRLLSGDVVVTLPGAAVLPAPLDVVAGAAAQIAVVFGLYAVVRSGIHRLAEARRVSTSGEARFRGLFDASPVPTIVARSMRISDANPAAERRFRDGASTIVGQFVSEVLPDELVDGVRQALADLQPDSPPVAVRFASPGSPAASNRPPVHLTPFSDDDGAAVIITIGVPGGDDDADAPAGSRQARGAAVFSALPAPVIVLAGDGRIDQVNAAAQQLFGERGVAPLGAQLGEVFDGVDEVLERWAMGDGDDGPLNGEVTCGAQHLAYRAVRLPGIAPDAGAAIVHLADVTSERRDRDELYRRARTEVERFHHHPIPLYRLDSSGVVVDANDAFKELFSSADDEVLKTEALWAHHFPADDAARIEHLLDTVGTVVALETDLPSEDGASRRILVSAVRHDTAAGTVVDGAVVDLTSRWETDRERDRNARLAAVLADVGRFLAEVDDDASVVRYAAAAVMEALDVDGVAVMGADGDQGLRRIDDLEWRTTDLQVDAERMAALAGYARVSTRTVTVPTAAPDEPPAGTAIGVRIGADGRYGALIALDASRREFRDAEQDFLTAVAALVAASMRRKEPRLSPTGAA